MADSEARTHQDIGQDEAWITNLKNQVDTHFNIGAQALQNTQERIGTCATQAQTEVAAINASTIQHIKDVNALTLNATQLAIDRQWNVNETDNVAKAILGGPSLAAIQAMVVAAVTDAMKTNNG